MTSQTIQTTKRGNPASALSQEASMAALSFSRVPANDAMLRGSLAAPKQRFGDNGRYAVAPVHTRFDAVEWFVWDAEAVFGLNSAEVIRQSATLEEALRGL